jgi:uncharacterized membrane protein
MVAAQCNACGSKWHFVIRPNCSLSWRGMIWVFAGISGVALATAVGFAMLGAWLVLPFAGLELLALAIGFYHCARRGAEREVIAIQGDTISIERGRYRPHQRYEFSRAWAQVYLKKARPRSYPSRLTIRSHGREVEIGAFLVEEEREWLARELRRRIAESSGQRDFAI